MTSGIEQVYDCPEPKRDEVLVQQLELAFDPEPRVDVPEREVRDFGCMSMEALKAKLRSDIKASKKNR